MERRTLVAALGTLPAATAGCLTDLTEAPTTERGGDSPDDGSVVSQFDGDVSRPECERVSETVEIEIDGEPHEFETAETVPYPDPLSEFTDPEVVEYVETFEHAYVTKNALCDRTGSGRIFRVDYSVLESETFDWYDDVAVVFLRRIGAATTGSDGAGNLWQADVASTGVVYAVDASGAARVDYADVHAGEDAFEPRAPDPLDGGELVATFE